MTDTIQVVTEQIPGPTGPTGPTGPQGTMPSEGVGDGRYTLTTTDANPTTIATVTVADNTLLAIEVYADAKLAGSSTCAFIARRDVYVRSGGGAPSQVDPVELLARRPASTSYEITFVPSGNTILVKVTGAANVKWSVEVKALKLTDG